MCGTLSSPSAGAGNYWPHAWRRRTRLE